MIRAVIFIAITILVFGTGCEKNALFNGGDTVSVKQDLDSFTFIEVINIFDITLVNDTANFAIVKCGENLQKNVRLNVLNDTLYFRNNNQHKWSRRYEKIKVELHLTDFHQMNIRNPVILRNIGELTLNSLSIIDWSLVSDINLTINVNKFFVMQGRSNNGTIVVNGEAGYAYLFASGSCFIDARNFSCTEIYARNNGIGYLITNPRKKLKASLEWTGDIYYINEPQELVVDKVLYSGKLIKGLPNQ